MKKLLVICNIVFFSLVVQALDQSERLNAYNVGLSCGTDCESCCAQAFPNNPSAQAVCKYGCKEAQAQALARQQHKYYDEREG